MKYRAAYVTEPGFDFSPLRELADHIVYVTSGFEKGVAEIKAAVEASLLDFEEDQDIFVPVGKVLSVFFAADCLASKKQLLVAVYDKRSYTIVDVRQLD